MSDNEQTIKYVLEHGTHCDCCGESMDISNRSYLNELPENISIERIITLSCNNCGRVIHFEIISLELKPI